MPGAYNDAYDNAYDNGVGAVINLRMVRTRSLLSGSVSRHNTDLEMD